jgi:hypothetical protein
MTKNESMYPASDFVLNLVSLRLIGAAIEAASGLMHKTLFMPQHERLETTVLWAMDALLVGSSNDKQHVLLNKSMAHFWRTMERVHSLDPTIDEEDGEDEDEDEDEH